MADSSFTTVDWPKFKIAALSSPEPYEHDESVIVSMPDDLWGWDNESWLREATDIHEKYREKLTNDDMERLDRIVAWTFGFDYPKPIDCELHADVSDDLWNPWCVLEPNKVSELAEKWESIDHGALKLAIEDTWEPDSQHAPWFSTPDDVWQHLDIWGRRTCFARDRKAGAVIDVA